MGRVQVPDPEIMKYPHVCTLKTPPSMFRQWVIANSWAPEPSVKWSSAFKFGNNNTRQIKTALIAFRTIYRSV